MLPLPLLKMKKAFDKKTYSKLYPFSSRPGLFFGLAKIHKMPEGDKGVNNLSNRPVIVNIGTATYEVSEYLADLLKPLSKSKYTMESTDDLINEIKGKSVEDQYDMVSFHVMSLFTNVPLQFTINLILDNVYKENVIKTTLKRAELEKLLWVCTTELHFTFNNVMYRQIGGVSMGSPLGPVLANIFMVELEEKLVPDLNYKMPLWLRYVDDTFTLIKKDELNNVKEKLNDFHPSIKFTCEKEEENTISFLDVKIKRGIDNTITTDIYRKKAETNLYINWNSFSPRHWKIGTLQGLVKRAYKICSEKSLVEKEVKHLIHVFINIYQYPKKLVENTIQKIEESIEIKKQNGINNSNQPATTLSTVNEEIKTYDFTLSRTKGSNDHK